MSATERGNGAKRKEADALSRLLDIGFKRIGRWAMEQGDLSLEMDAAQDGRNVLYAFMVDDEVKYIGKTVRSLRARLYQYLRPGPTQSTNIRNRANILAALEVGKSVHIFALIDDESRHVGEFHLNVAAGLEDSLISNLGPEWNGAAKMKQSPISSAVPAPPTSPNPPTLPRQSTPAHVFHLRPTYFNQGFFNVPADSSRFYGADNAAVQIYCGNSTTSMTGKINRSANDTGTPRIICGAALRNWFQRECRVNQVLGVEVLQMNAIRITPE